MKIIKKPELTENDCQSIFYIWNAVYPSQVAFSKKSEFVEYINKAGTPRHYCAISDGKLVGWSMTFHRENKRWFTILIAQNYQNLGIGGEMLSQIKGDETEINGWILTHDNYQTLSGEIYLSPKEFYIKNGFRFTNESHISRGMKFTKICWLSK